MSAVRENATRASADSASAGVRLYARLVPAVRMVLGLEFFLNGLNWWVKLIDPYPSISDYLHQEPPQDVVGAMIKSGILFHLVKALELGAGVALLTNRFVPLALVAVLPVTVNVFVVDVVISHHLRAHIMGSGALMMSAFLMFSYFRYYKPMFAARTEFDTPQSPPAAVQDALARWLDPQASSLGRKLLAFGGIVSLLIGAVMIVWVLVMIVQHFAHQ